MRYQTKRGHRAPNWRRAWEYRSRRYKLIKKSLIFLNLYCPYTDCYVMKNCEYECTYSVQLSAEYPNASSSAHINRKVAKHSRGHGVYGHSDVPRGPVRKTRARSRVSLLGTFSPRGLSRRNNVYTPRIPVTACRRRRLYSAVYRIRIYWFWVWFSRILTLPTTI